MICRLPTVTLILACVAACGAGVLRAQSSDVSEQMLRLVMPQADRFGPKDGSPPVFRAYEVDDVDGEERLVGYVFLTPDVPPERLGYSGPIDALIGMDLRGIVTRVRVVSYYESYMSQMGDFLRRPGFQEQYTGKAITEAFLVRRDIEGISRATISSRAISRGVRDAARRVADAYLDRPVLPSGIPEPSTLTWLELLQRDVVQQIVVTSGDAVLAEISVAYVDSWQTGDHLVGSAALGMTIRAVDSRGGSDHVMVYGVDGPEVSVFSREGWSVLQGSDTFALNEGDVFPFGLAGGGLMEDEMSTTGAMILPAAVDVTRPFVLQIDLRPRRSVYATEYTPLDAQLAAASPAPTEPASPGPEPAAPEPTRVEPVVEDVPPIVADADSPTDETVLPVDFPVDSSAAEAPIGLGPTFDYQVEEDETVFARTLAGISWSRTAAAVALLILASVAFFRKQPGIRWATLALTLGYLGFLDGGFLSVSHITSGIWVGASAFLNDVPLLLIAAFTVITTLIFGRVFCGFLCPFGALQDFITRIVPRRFQRRVPEALHRRGLLLKYGILALIIVPAALGVHTSTYAYFEPFGTVFFLSHSWVLWTIALGFIAASAVVPRFYCRYACPLGAALALGSLVAPKRIKRVEHCNHCKVCENACPTGAIRGPVIDFKECVRCNACETLLIDKAGVCGHDMDEIRPRLVQLRVGSVGSTK